MLDADADLRAMPREQRPLFFIIAALIALALALEIANGRFWLSDFRVYYSAADALIHGGQVYGVPFGEDTGFYKYAPVVAMAFVPFALLPYPLAAGLHFLLIGVALSLALLRLERLLMRHVFGAFPSRILVRGVLALLCIAVLLSRELHLGNINLWLVVGTILATEAALEDNDGEAGVLFGILWLTKPYLAFMIVPLVVANRWPILRHATITMAIAILLPMAFLGPSSWLSLHAAWLEAMSAHSGYLASPDTLAAMAATWTSSSGPLQHPRLVLVVVGTAFTLLCWWQQRAAARSDQALMLQLWSAFALVPNLVITDQEHFMYGLPLIAFVLACLFRTRDALLLVVFSLAMLLYGTRSSDLWGSDLENQLVAAGTLGLGNLLLVISAWVAHARRSLP